MNIQQLNATLQTLVIVLSLANIGAIFFTLDYRQRLFQMVIIALWLIAALAAWFSYPVTALVFQIIALFVMVYAFRLKNTWKQQQTKL